MRVRCLHQVSHCEFSRKRRGKHLHVLHKRLLTLRQNWVPVSSELYLVQRLVQRKRDKMIGMQVRISISHSTPHSAS